jgi:arylformamidase
MKRVIDMSHCLIPGRSGRKLNIEMIGADEVNPNVVRLKNQWYIMHNITMVSHIGTHIEAPYHLFKDGPDLAGLSLERLYGEAVVLDLRSVPPQSAITPEATASAAQIAGGIKNGDIVLCHLGYAAKYGTPEYSQAPYFSPAAIQWLITAGMKMMGVDAGGVEVPGSEEHVNHRALFEQGIPLIENVAAFDALHSSRVELAAFPIAVVGLESFPVRVVAFDV